MEPIVNDSTADTPTDELTDKDRLDRYKMEIQLYEKDFKPWETKGNKIVKRYRDDRAATQTNPVRFNILYSNVQTLAPAAYGKNPKPDIQRRFRDDDPLGRVTSDVLERATSYFVNDKFYNTVKRALQDRLLPGRGCTWVRYEPHMRDMEAVEGSELPEGVSITGDVYTDSDGKPVQETYFEEVCHDYVYWKDFGHNTASTWSEVYLVWRRVNLDKDELIERFGKKVADLCPMDYSPRGLSDEKEEQVLKKSRIYEAWDKKRGKVYWIHRDVDRFLDVKDDPLHLPDFFPCPKPLLGVTTNESLIPVPDFVEYQDQAMELDELTTRISMITKAVKVVGVYDASAQGVERMLNEGVENRLIAVESWAVFGEKGGLKGAMELMPVKELAEVLLVLYESRERVKNDLYEITGIADIIRGATKASETATAQNIKSQFATLRLDQIQHSVARFAKEMVVNTALIIAEHFSLDTIKAISGVHLLTDAEKQQLVQQQQMAAQTQQEPPPVPDKVQELLESPTWEEVFALLRDQPHLTFKIDIETDSTIKADEIQDKADRVEFLTAAGTFIQQATQVPNPEMLPLLVEMLRFGIRGFKVAKSIEGAFDTILKKVEKAAANPAPPPPDPTAMKIEADKQSEQMRMQADAQAAQLKTQGDAAKLQADQQADAAKLQNQITIEQMKIAADKEKTQMQIAADREIALMQMAQDDKNAQADREANKEKGDLDRDAKSKPAVSINAGDEISGIAEGLRSLGETTAKQMGDAMAQLVAIHSAPKEITLDNGRKATVNPRVQ